MTTQNQALFEAPASHERTQYSNPEMEYEWGNPEASYNSNPEWEDEWGNPEASYNSNPEYEDEWGNPEATYNSNPEYEDEWGNPEASYNSNPEYEDEWGNPEASYNSNPEWEDEGEYFFNKRTFRKFRKGFKNVARAAAPLAKKLAPKLAGQLVSLIPGAGPALAPVASKLTRAMLQEGEMEVAQMEAEFFGINEADPEVAPTEVAYEAALTEFLAAQAAEATTEAEAEAVLGAALPLTIQVFAGKRALRPVVPVLAQANSKLVKTLRQQGAPGRQLLRAVPEIQRQTVAALKAATRAGKPINGPLAVQTMAAATHKVLSNPRIVQQAIERNAVLRQRTARPSLRSAVASREMGADHCPNCGKVRR